MNSMNNKLLMDFGNKPKLYRASTNKFWDDEHISTGMLEAHLNPHQDGASRTHDFIDKSVDWVTTIIKPQKGTKLLDLGCGPGFYTSRFYQAGYEVTGIDFSKRSISYAKEQCELNDWCIDYHYQDYLTIDYTEEFEIITMIYCDFAVLSESDRKILIEKVYRALKPNGIFLFDVFTEKMRKTESKNWYKSEEDGFFSPISHMCLQATYQYDDEDQTQLEQYVILTEKISNPIISGIIFLQLKNYFPNLNQWDLAIINYMEML